MHNLHRCYNLSNYTVHKQQTCMPRCTCTAAYLNCQIGNVLLTVHQPNLKRRRIQVLKSMSPVILSVASLPFLPSPFLFSIFPVLSSPLLLPSPWNFARGFGTLGSAEPPPEVFAALLLKTFSTRISLAVWLQTAVHSQDLVEYRVLRRSCLTLPCDNSYGEITSPYRWPRYNRHFAGVTWHNAWN